MTDPASFRAAIEEKIDKSIADVIEAQPGPSIVASPPSMTAAVASTLGAAAGPTFLLSPTGIS